MPLEATPQTLYDTVLYVQACHLQEHAAALRVRVLPLPFLTCATCQAIMAAVGVAHALAETTAPSGRTRA